MARPQTRAERIAARNARRLAQQALSDSDTPEAKAVKQAYRAEEFAASYNGRYEFTKTWFWRPERAGEETMRDTFEKWILPRKQEINRYLEIGCCEGQSLIWMLENVLQNGGYAHGVDPYKNRKHQRQFDEHKARLLKNLEAYRQPRAEVCGRCDGTGEIAAGAHDGYFVCDDCNGAGTLPPFAPVPVVMNFLPSQIALAQIVGARKVGDWDCPEPPIFGGAQFDMALVDGDHRAGECLLDSVLAFGLLRIGGILVIDDLRRRWFRQRPFVYEGVQAFLMAFEKRYTVLFRAQNQIGLIRTE